VRCVPLPDGAVVDGKVDVRAFAERLGMGTVDGDGVSALGPASGGHVRPPETAFPGKVSLPDDVPAEPSPELIEVAQEVVKIRVSPKRYLAASRDWAEHGTESRFAVDPAETVRRSKPLPPEVSLAGAHFELAQHRTAIPISSGSAIKVARNTRKMATLIYTDDGGKCP
jgi:hypothetical protein